MRDFFKKVLAHLGHDVVAVAADGLELVEQCRHTTPDLVITDIAMPNLDGLEALRIIGRERPIPGIIVSAHHDNELVRRALQEQVLAYLVKPITIEDLQPAIALAMQRYREFEALHAQAENLKQALEDRKLLERAKGILMARTGLSEPDAFRRLQLLSSTQNRKMVEVARMIVTADEAFAPAQPEEAAS
jgi:response regulator NasT